MNRRETPLPAYPGLAAFWKSRHGGQVRRVALDAGLGCPHRASGGCSFCDPASFSPAAGDPRSIVEQLAEGVARLRRRGISRFAAYFQPGTNTNAPPEVLAELWETAASFPGVVALCVGTRPDCLPDEVLDLMASFSRRVEVWLEIGLQSAHDDTLSRLQRGHDAARFADAVARARSRDILVAAHVILGLPGEAEAREVATARFLTACGVEGVKLHQLALVAGTPLAEEYSIRPFPLLTEEEYIRRAVAFLENLPPSTVIHRLVGDTMGEGLLSPRMDKTRLTAEIRRRLAAGK